MNKQINLLVLVLMMVPCAAVAQDTDDGDGAKDPAQVNIEEALRNAGLLGGAPGSAAPVSAPASAPVSAPAPASAVVPASVGVDASGGAASVAPQGYDRADIGAEDAGITRVLYPEAKVQCEMADPSGGLLPGKFGLYKFVAQRPDCSAYDIQLPWNTTLSGAQLGFGRGFSQNVAWDPTLTVVANCLKSDPRIKGRVIPRMDATRLNQKRLKDGEFREAAKMKYGLPPSQLTNEELQTLVGDWRIEGIMRLLRAKGVDTTSRVVGSMPVISTAEGGDERGMRIELFWEAGKPIYVPYCERRPAPPVKGERGEPGVTGRSGFEGTVLAGCEIGQGPYGLCGPGFELAFYFGKDVAVYGTLIGGAGTYDNANNSFEFEHGFSYKFRAGPKVWFAEWFAAEVGPTFQEEGVDRRFYKRSRAFGFDLGALFYPGDDHDFVIEGRAGYAWWARKIDEETDVENPVGRKKGTGLLGGLFFGYRFK